MTTARSLGGRLAPLSVVVAIAWMSVVGCSATSYLADDEVLYTGAEVSITGREHVPDDDDLEDQLTLLVRPEPNGKFLGLFRSKLWLYNIGIFKESMGEPPVLLSSVAPDRVAAKMRTLLDNKGYFWGQVSYEVDTEEHTAEIRYTVTVEAPYRINGTSVESGDHALLEAIRSTMKETILLPGSQYDLDRLKEERVRIDAALKEMGIFHFSPDFLVFQADTTAGQKTIDLSLRIKSDIPAEAKRVHTIGDLTVISGYSLDRDSAQSRAGDTQRLGRITYVDLDQEFEPDVILRSIFFRPGAPSSRKDHELTLNRLMNLGVVKFVSIRYANADSAGHPQLLPQIGLTPMLMNNIRFELQGVSKSNNLVGPVFTTSLRNRNLFRGAELFTLSGEVGFETPIGGGPSGGSSLEVGVRGALDFPQFLTPFRIDRVSGLFVPRTRIELGFRLLQRLEYYQLVSVDASIGYHWRPSVSIEHQFRPLSITFAHLTATTPRFTELLNVNPLMRRSFEEQGIIGQTYAYIYNDQLAGVRRNNVYFRGNVDLSGNLLQLAQSAVTRRRATPEEPYTIFGVAYSEYAKVDVDLRHYYNTASRTSSIASRVIAGIGVPYGNSASLPYVKQFFIGGSNSVRAFVARGLGPGSYRPPDSVSARSFIDQAGDIMVEANTEYRFPIVSVLRGALFVDVGNMWLLRNDPVRPGGAFSGKTFVDELAVGTGVGVRIDLSFFVLRFDLAWPLRIPSLPAGDRWVIRKIDFGSPTWRKQNLVLNVAIGYPY